MMFQVRKMLFGYLRHKEAIYSVNGELVETSYLETTLINSEDSVYFCKGILLKTYLQLLSVEIPSPSKMV